MALQAVAHCDCPGCTTPPVYGVTRGGLEWDLTVRPPERERWSIEVDVVRCPACITAHRWPDARVETIDIHD